jgi:hypothetical protein
MSIRRLIDWEGILKEAFVQGAGIFLEMLRKIMKNVS